MFTGIIESMAEVQEWTDNTIRIKRPLSFDDVQVGSSICVSGVCLSVVKRGEDFMEFDVVPETLESSKFGSIQPGDKVNLERSLPASGRFDGHIVHGHTYGVGVVKRIIGKVKSEKLKVKNAGTLVVEVPKDLIMFIIHKGSIALDGVSLTVASLEENQITIALIPHTLESTTLGLLQEGDKVNIETDILGKYVEHFLPITPQ